MYDVLLLQTGNQASEPAGLFQSLSLSRSLEPVTTLCLYADASQPLGCASANAFMNATSASTPSMGIAL